MIKIVDQKEETMSVSSLVELVVSGNLINKQIIASNNSKKFFVLSLSTDDEYYFQSIMEMEHKITENIGLQRDSLYRLFSCWNKIALVESQEVLSVFNMWQKEEKEEEND